MSSLNRREFLIRSGLASGAVALGGPAFLTACGGSTSSGGAGGGGSVRMASWPLYIGDDKQPNKTPTLSSFTEATKLKVTYKTAVDDNDSFTEKYRATLEKGKDIGFDAVVLTSWMVARWIRKGWVHDLPDIPNKVNLLERLANPSWDAGRKKSLPYAIGQVGIAYYPDQTGFEIKSVNDLLDPRLKGRVSLLSEVRDTVGLFMLAEGKDPSKVDIAGAKATIEKIKQARDGGQFRKIAGNSYVDDLTSGDVWAAVAWSGDVASIQADQKAANKAKPVQWVFPADGAMSFTDTLLIPAGAKNVEGAGKLINHFYDPAISGPLFESISYVSPVKGAGEKMSADAGKNPLINPPATAKIVEFADLTDDEADELSKSFDEATKL